MASNPTGKCEVCGKLAKVHLTKIRDATKSQRWFCVEHTPVELKDKVSFGARRSAAKEVALLRQTLLKLEEQVPDPAERAKFQAEIEKLIADIEAGRRRIDDAD